MALDENNVPVCIHLDASNLPQELRDYFDDREMWTHDSDHVIPLFWNDPENYSELKEYLINTYGKHVKFYDRVAISGT